MTGSAARLSNVIFVAMLAFYVWSCDLGKDEGNTSSNVQGDISQRVSVKDARPIWLNALHSALTDKVDVHLDYIIMRDPYLGQTALIHKYNVIIQCDPMFGVEILGFLGGDEVPAVSLDLIAVLDGGRQYIVPRILEDDDDPAVMDLMRDLCIEVANALDTALTSTQSDAARE
jgi:hypothetical protein